MTLLKQVIAIARDAGTAILLAKRTITVSKKSDGSQLTNADMASHALIVEQLTKISRFPIVSEESVPPKIPRGSPFWLIDPLDGTRGFVQGSDEYSVNIALIEQGRLIMGVIGLPARKKIYWAQKGSGAFCNGKSVRNRAHREKLIGVVSVSENNRELEFLKKQGIHKILRYHSAIKFCMVAEGSADIYARLHGSKIWDNAAGHIIVKEAGCDIVEYETGLEPRYTLTHYESNHFICGQRNAIGALYKKPSQRNASVPRKTAA